ncbi:hypothetical protein MPH_13188 [Macrophomina phaseolina MS6]|uniref:Rhodopsin domain-containing protein n=2 Tax=Macrophomina phaseolina TaxID=35725 RepID=K2RZ66_MACPH|nr:hypothetical protein MPH_13188 [Macrophomina phaseolina MS6]KAH7058994.1 hypothetical protein B0J12DRAFT_380653 [Macrophomina phaseolina]
MVDPLLAALIETWTLYSGGTVIIMARVYCRWRMVGFYNFKPDDYMVIWAWVVYTGMTVAAHMVGGLGDIGAIPADQRASLTKEQAASLVLGTKWFVSGWYTYVSLIWTLKMNMLFLYQRVVNGLWVAKFIKPTMFFVGVTYISIILLVSLVCRPYHKMWQVMPDPGPTCKAQSAYLLIPTLVCNLLTDICIMLIPAPVILPLKTTILRKIGLFILFGAGIFVMAAAILRVVFVLGLGNGKTAAIWSCREDIVAIFVGQATMIRPIFTRKFWTGGYGPGSTHHSSKAAPISFELAEHTIGGGGGKRSGGFRKKDPYASTTIMATMQESDSTEKIIDSESRHSSAGGGRNSGADLEAGTATAAAGGSAGKSVGLEINVKREVDVESLEYSNGGRRYGESLQAGWPDRQGLRNSQGGRM